MSSDRYQGAVCSGCGRYVVLARCSVCDAPVPCGHFATCGAPECQHERKMRLQRERRATRARMRAAAAAARDRAVAAANSAPPAMPPNRRPSGSFCAP